MKLFRLAPVFLALLNTPLSAQDEVFTFDVGEFERKAFELTGYVEFEPAYARSNQDGALYKLQFFDLEEPSSVERYAGILELEGRFHKEDFSAHFQTHSEISNDVIGTSTEHSLYQGYASWQPNSELVFDVGKKAIRWGKGYSWNPVAFVERTKDAGDPDLAREGYWIAGADWIQRFDGPLQTLALTTLVLPVTDDFNADFGKGDHTHLAAKLYLLYRDIDFDFMFLSQGSRGTQLGMDFSHNVAPNFEIHGEFAYFNDVVHRTVTDDCKSGPSRVSDELGYLFGLRYRTDDDVTLLWEYYYNGRGNDKEQQQKFFDCVHQAWETGDDTVFDQLPQSRDIERGVFSRPNPMRRYMSYRAWWEEPWDFLYLTTGVGVLHNLEDQSFSVSPEVTYEGFENIELRLRGTMPIGDRLSEWGEKPNEYKIELEARYYF